MAETQIEVGAVQVLPPVGAQREQRATAAHGVLPRMREPDGGRRERAFKVDWHQTLQ